MIYGTVTRENEEIVFKGDADKSALNLNEVIKVVKCVEPNPRREFNEIYKFLGGVGFDFIGVNSVFTEQWSVSKLNINCDEYIVLYRDKYSLKIRTNFNKVIKDDIVIKRNPVHKNTIMFISKSAINRDCKVLSKQIELTDNRIKQLKNEKQSLIEKRDVLKNDYLI